MNLLKHKFLLFLAAFAFVGVLYGTAVPAPVYAQECLQSEGCVNPDEAIDKNCGDGVAIQGSGGNVVCCPKGTAPNDATGCIFNKYLNPLVTMMSAAVGIAVVASIVLGAVQYSSAGGDPAKVQKAKDRIRNAIIALIAYFFLFSLLQWLIPGGIL